MLPSCQEHTHCPKGPAPWLQFWRWVQGKALLLFVGSPKLLIMILLISVVDILHVQPPACIAGSKAPRGARNTEDPHPLPV